MEEQDLDLENLVAMDISNAEFDQLLLHAARYSFFYYYSPFSQSSNQSSLNKIISSVDFNKLSMVNLVTKLILRKIKQKESVKEITDQLWSKFFDSIKTESIRPPALYLMLFLSHHTDNLSPRLVSVLSNVTTPVNQAYIVQMIEYTCRYDVVPKFIVQRIRDIMNGKPTTKLSTIIVGDEAYIDLIEEEKVSSDSETLTFRSHFADM
jgi:hypothetical protein